jgi:hypothetical protein
MFLKLSDSSFSLIGAVTMGRDELIPHFFFRDIFFRAADALLSMVWSLGLKRFAVILLKTTPSSITHSAPDLDLMAIGWL